MGNIICDENLNTLKNDSSIDEINKIIRNWALNDYDAGLNYNKGVTIKNLLKKRACCTRNNNINISLPYFNDTYDSLKEGYFSCKIDDIIGLNSNDLFDSSKCNFNPDFGKNIPVNYFQVPISQLGGENRANENCTNIYSTNINSLNLCGSIKGEQDINYSNNRARKSYGYYGNDAVKLESFNSYRDCNCLNSVLREIKQDNLDINDEEISSLSNLNIYESLVQTNDAYCSKCATEGTCYIPSNQISRQLCVNIASLKDIITDNNSNVKNNQICSSSGGGGSSGTVVNLGDTSNIGYELTTFINKYRTTIIVTLLITIISIVGLIKII